MLLGTLSFTAHGKLLRAVLARLDPLPGAASTGCEDTRVRLFPLHASVVLER